MKGKFDIMVGEYYYGIISGEFETNLKLMNNEIVSVYDNEDILKKIYIKFPTLKNKEFEVFPYKENEGLLILKNNE